MHHSSVFWKYCINLGGSSVSNSSWERNLDIDDDINEKKLYSSIQFNEMENWKKIIKPK